MIEKMVQQNVQLRIRGNNYPGRGIIIGKNDLGDWVQVYWIMGRSANSCNRLFVFENNVLRTEAVDPTKVEDPSLIFYNAMRETRSHTIVSNGKQTDKIVAVVNQGGSFEESLLSQHHEPDAPNYTPRISGCISWTRKQPQVILSVIKKSPFDIEQSYYKFYHYNYIENGYGYTCTTYLGNGNPLPSFRGSPYLLPLRGNATEILDFYWQQLNQNHLISVAVKTLKKQKLFEMKIRNKFQPIPSGEQ